jgi:hypothetical protein
MPTSSDTAVPKHLPLESFFSSAIYKKSQQRTYGACVRVLICYQISAGKFLFIFIDYIDLFGKFQNSKGNIDALECK